ncbi:glycerol-3-phosphate dehydrogenase subunit GlpB [Arcanobacterium haemolyticum]|nr:glycerol-3-phosphate dehydrogenase subunit GlpB [Arcanobacterium haemolyticum]
MRTVVIGAGISGLTAALMAREAGHTVTVITKGFGGLQLSQGTVDIFDAEHPLEAINELPDSHPYSLISAESIKAGIAAFSKVYPVQGDYEKTTKYPTALGALRATSFVPASMAAGAIESGKSYVLVGFTGLKDFYPKLAAENLANQGIQARAEMLELTAPGDTALAFSRSLAEPGAAENLGRRLAAIAQQDEVIGIPAVVREGDFEKIAQASGHPVFQIPLPPPGVNGLDANERLRAACQEARVRFFLNAEAVGAVAENGAITAVKVHVAGSVKDVPADHVIYAAGGLDSGAIVLDSYRNLTETVFNLPVQVDDEILHGDYLGAPQPLFAAGLRVDSDMRPLGDSDEPVYTNLHAVGGMLAGAQRAHEKSGEGIALGSAAQAVAAILRSQS